MNDQATAAAITGATAEPGVEVRQLAPAALLLDRNVRLDPRLDAAFVASIKEHGVLQPIVGIDTGEGVRVRFGHRRTLAAIEAKLPTVPVVVLTGADDQIERLITQYVENAHRTGLTDAEQLGVFEQLAAFGLSPAQIARKTRAPRAHVDHALTVAKSALARAATARYDFLTLDQAATVAEFDGAPDAVTALVAAAKIGQFAHVAQRLRDDRAAKARLAAFTADLAATGVSVIDKPHDGPTRRLDWLRDGEDNPLTEETHRTCPGHAAYVAEAWGWIDPATGEPHGAQPDGDEDGGGDTAEEATADGGEAGQTEPEWNRYLTAVYVCTDPAANGHRDTRPRTASGAPQRGPLSDEEKAQRRLILENNKAWRSAETVRRTWLRDFLTRKSAPKGGALFVAACLAEGDHALRRAMEARHALARDLLGIDPTAARRIGAGDRLDDLIAKASEGRAAIITLGLVLAAHEAATSVHTWRNADRSTRRYFQFLADHGYHLADVERSVLTPSEGNRAA